MVVNLGHAVASEHSNKYGSAGNQNGKELRFQNWYNGKWNVVLRPISNDIAEKIAISMERAVNNKNIGYDQRDRISLYTQAEKRNWQIHLITTKCECDCSSLVAVCVNASGVKVSKDIYTGNMVKALIATGKFEKLTDKKYLKEDSYLKRGDILVCEGSHTVVALSNGDKVKVDKDYTDVNYSVTVNAFWLNVRSEPNAKSKVVESIKKNTVVYITKQIGIWGYSNTYKGWINMNYTKKNVSQSIVSPYIVSTTTTVNFRTSPYSKDSSNIITKFNKGQYLLITTEKTDGWVYGRTTIDGTVKGGWIFKDYIKEVNLNLLEKRKVTDATGLNIRTQGNLKASLIGTIPFNGEFNVLNSDNWGVVVYNDILGYSNLSKSYSDRI